VAAVARRWLAALAVALDRCFAIAYATPTPNGSSLPAVIERPVTGAIPGPGSLLVKVVVRRSRIPPFSAIRSRCSRPSARSAMPITCGTSWVSPRKRSLAWTVGR
jgi:hypothetical protein